MINTVSIIVRRPLGDERAVLGIRTAYATQAGGYDTSLTMMGDGVYCLVGGLPPYLKNMITMFVESEGRLTCSARSLEERGLKSSDLVFPDVEILDQDDLGELTEDSDTVNLF